MKYSQLTEEQKKIICNGCGPKGGWVKVPDFLFLASCNHHDFKYWIGNTEEERKKYDDEFYEWMKVDVSLEKNIVKRMFYSVWAYAYYKAVRFKGYKYYNYGEKKTEKDLEELINGKV